MSCRSGRQNPKIAPLSMKQRHDKGDPRAVLDALDHCFSCRPIKPVPKWAQKAFCEAYAKVFNAKAGSWDDVFGKPKGHMKSRRRRKEREFSIWKYVRSFHAQGKAIDDEMFVGAGKEFHVGARQAKEMYYRIEKVFGDRSNLWDPPPHWTPKVKHKVQY
jgi:hypothetical protein